MLLITELKQRKIVQWALAYAAAAFALQGIDIVAQRFGGSSCSSLQRRLLLVIPAKAGIQFCL